MGLAGVLDPTPRPVLVPSLALVEHIFVPHRFYGLVLVNALKKLPASASTSTCPATQKQLRRWSQS